MCDKPADNCLYTRLQEHKHAVRTADFHASVLAEHAWNQHHPINWDKATVLTSESNLHRRLTLESRYIRKSHQTLNREDGGLLVEYTLDEVYSIHEWLFFLLIMWFIYLFTLFIYVCLFNVFTYLNFLDLYYLFLSMFLFIIKFFELFYSFLFLYNYVCFIPIMSQSFTLHLVCDTFVSHSCSLLYQHM